MTARSVLGDSWTIYKRLFVRTVLAATVVFAVLELPGVFLGYTDSKTAAALIAFVSLALSFVGSLIVQGALSQAVRDVHEGAAQRSTAELYEGTRRRFGALVGGSLLLVLGIAGAFLVTGGAAVAVIAFAGPFALPVLLVPLAAVFVLWTRWSLIVPVIVLEQTPTMRAFRRSRELVRGHGLAVFRILFLAALITTALGFALRFAFAALPGALGVWIGAAIATGLTAPYMAHALTVTYYRLADPSRPMIPS